MNQAEEIYRAYGVPLSFMEDTPSIGYSSIKELLINCVKKTTITLNKDIINMKYRMLPINKKVKKKFMYNFNKRFKRK